VTSGRITLLLDRFSKLIATAAPEQRYPALETLLRRGKPSNHGCSSSDELRCELFGLECAMPPPVAALTRIADGLGHPDEGGYWLRLDPASFWPDMARVVMAGCGFADFDEQERGEIESTVRDVLMQEGMELQTGHPEHWTIALKQPLQFQFTPLEEALGMDVAEVLPDHPDALYWRRILNEIQMALHACPVNVRRRQRGRMEINSVWFWGGGPLPERAARPAFETVYSSHPVSRGLALLHGCALHDLGAAENAEFPQEAGNILLDWSSRPAGSATTELEHLERISAQLLTRVRNQALSVYLCTAGGAAWSFDRHSMRRWWQRRVPLAAYTGVSGA